MEIESIDGSIIPIDRDSKTEIGRGLGLGLGPSSSDRTVSRRHLSLHVTDPGDEIRVLFEVIGKNPIWVCSRSGRDKRVHRKSEKGNLEDGDRFSLSLKNPYFFVVKRREGGKAEVEKRISDAVDRREKRTLERRKEKGKREKAEVSEEEGGEEAVIGGLGLELGSLDVSQIDPVKEFGFLAKGHEFEQYPRQKIRAFKNWNWFLEEPGEHSDKDEPIDEAASAKGKGRKRKKKKVGLGEDEDWTGESEDEKVLVVKGGSSKLPKYSTRSKDQKKPHNDAIGGRKSALQKDVKAHKDEVDEEEEEEETLGGFIVNDGNEEEVEEEELGEEELEEEEEDDEEEDEEDYDDE